jgi:hypothetical protein
MDYAIEVRSQVGDSIFLFPIASGQALEFRFTSCQMYEYIVAGEGVQLTYNFNVIPTLKMHGNISVITYASPLLGTLLCTGYSS